MGEIKIYIVTPVDIESRTDWNFKKEISEKEGGKNIEILKIEYNGEMTQNGWSARRVLYRVVKWKNPQWKIRKEWKLSKRNNWRKP
jgi:hypothetical protein